MSPDTETRRLQWHSRRGMLELDVLLEPFITHAYSSLDREDQERYKRLLDCEDQDLFSWFMGSSQPTDPDIARIIELILEYARQHPRR